MCRLPGIVVVAHFVCIKLITTRHAMLTMRGTKRERGIEGKGGSGGCASKSHRNAKTLINYSNFWMPKAAAKAKAWLRLCATRRIRNIVINLISACNARQAHTVRVCVCPCVRACVCLTSHANVGKNSCSWKQLSPEFWPILCSQRNWL